MFTICLHFECLLKIFCCIRSECIRFPFGSFRIGIERKLFCCDNLKLLLNARLASAFHQFGWVFRGSISRSYTKGKICHGKRIAVQATAAGRRRGKTSHGKSKVPAGRSLVDLNPGSDL